MSKRCAPNRENNRLSCYTKQNLEDIAKSYNKTCPSSKKIKIKNKTKTELWNVIRKSLSDRCNTEICWAQQPFLNDSKVLKESFRPRRPKSWEKENYTTWLNTDDINHVMKQYEKKYPDFLFIGPVPLDCGINTDLHCQLTNFNINKLHKNGINKVGIGYNLSNHTGSGSHWMSCFIEIEKRTANIEYYDSYGSKYPIEIRNLLERIKSDLKKDNINAKINVNTTRHQYDDYNCGMYSMFFIVKRLEGKTLKQIEKMKLPSGKMQKLKKIWYRN